MVRRILHLRARDPATSTPSEHDRNGMVTGASSHRAPVQCHQHPSPTGLPHREDDRRSSGPACGHVPRRSSADGCRPQGQAGPLRVHCRPRIRWILVGLVIETTARPHGVGPALPVFSGARPERVGFGTNGGPAKRKIHDGILILAPRADRIAHPRALWSGARVNDA